MFSFIKTMRSDPSRVMPNRSYLTMEMPFLRAYTQVRGALRGLLVGSTWVACTPIPGCWAADLTPPLQCTQLVIKTCHRRGAFAMGGMSAVIPIKGDEAANKVS